MFVVWTKIFLRKISLSEYSPNGHYSAFRNSCIEIRKHTDQWWGSELSGVCKGKHCVGTVQYPLCITLSKVIMCVCTLGSSSRHKIMQKNWSCKSTENSKI